MSVDWDKQRNAAMFLLVGLEEVVRESGMLIDPQMEQSFRRARKEFNRVIPARNRKYGIEKAKDMAGKMHKDLAHHIKRSLDLAHHIKRSLDGDE